MPINAFQQGQQFQLTQEARSLKLDAARRREKGINALGDQFGEGALAPTEFATVTGAVGREDTRKVNIKNNVEDRAVKAQEREDAGKLEATDKMISFVEAGLANNQPPEEIIARAGPALAALGVSPEEIGTLPQQLTDNPNLVTELRGALDTQKKQAAPRRVIGQPIAVRRPDGSTALLQTFSDGSTQILDEGTPLSAELAEQRVDIAERRVGISQQGVGVRLSELDRKNLTDVRSEIKEVNQRRTFNETTVAASQTVIRDINTVTDLARTATGFGGSSMTEALSRAAAAGIPGADAFEIQQLVDSIKSNVGIDSLLRIKQSGAGLGQVPQSQLETLQSLLGNLNISRSPDLLLRDLNDINTRYNDVVSKSQDSITELDKRELKLLKRRDTIEKRSFPAGTPEAKASIEDLLNKFAPVGEQ